MVVKEKTEFSVEALWLFIKAAATEREISIGCW